MIYDLYFRHCKQTWIEERQEHNQNEKSSICKHCGKKVENYLIQGYKVGSK